MIQNAARHVRAWQEQHWVVPLIADDAAGDFSTLRLSLASLFPDDVMDRLQARFGERFASLEENGRLAVATAEAEGRVTNVRLQELTTVHARDLTFLLRRLVDDGFLESHGDRRGAWYTVREAAGSEGTPDSGASRGGLLQSLHRTLHQSLHQTSVDLGTEDLVAEVAALRWAPRARVEAAILQLCRGQFMTAKEIARRLGRSVTTIRNKYVPVLVAAGRLELEDREHPTRPEQAYRTLEERS